MQWQEFVFLYEIGCVFAWSWCSVDFYDEITLYIIALLRSSNGVVMKKTGYRER